MAMSSRARWLWLLAALSAGTTRGDVRQVILPAATTVSSPAGARAGFSASCGTRSLDSHVYPYVRVVRIDERTHTLIHEPDITSSERAWQLPAVAIAAISAASSSAVVLASRRSRGSLCGLHNRRP
jgi:hypothetical protein